ncbi:hypothetical protein AB833_21050 [Chromatiales bacterium (ex Bugula neritina AB1)]|nr:hypothetical protein AB833_21050 [Chromatiales bacterium (ex Bugula neritina AB1)]
MNNSIKLYTSSADEAETSAALDIWRIEVLKNNDPRDRGAVTGHRLSRGPFGKFSLSLSDQTGSIELLNAADPQPAQPEISSDIE